MAREQFLDGRMGTTSLEVVAHAEAICEAYAAQGLDLTLRQLYYQFVSRGLLENSDRSYKRLGGIINTARMQGRLDWSYIKDRGRNVRGSFYGWNDPGQFIGSMAERYSEALWLGQDYRPEVWVEKEALISVIGRACGPRRVPHFACKGYVSQSEMYDAAKRMQYRVRAGLTPVVIHLGDHDPSGIDMTRDIQERLTLMSSYPIRVDRIALNMDQIEQYDPPPNPAKLTDSRGAGYVEQYGDSSWELDALEPTVLNDLIEGAVDALVDEDAWDEAVEAEDASTARLVELSQRYDDLDSHWSQVLDVIGEPT